MNDNTEKMNNESIKPDIEYLAKKNPHPRDSHITFDEGPHIYTIDGDSGFTSLLHGITVILRNLMPIEL